MKHKEYVKNRELKDLAFRKACDDLKIQFELRKTLIGARLAAGLTQTELAEKLGTTQSAIARLESGKQIPSIETLYHLAMVLKVGFSITPQRVLDVNFHIAA